MRYFLIIFAGFVLAAVASMSASATKLTPPSSYSNISCANVRCGYGMSCVETPGGPVCEPASSAPSCASTLCMVGNQCVETASGPQCVPAQPSHPTYPSQPSYPSYPTYQQQSCAYGGYYQYGRLVCYPPPAWRHPYQYGWGHYYDPRPVPRPVPRPAPRPVPRPVPAPQPKPAPLPRPPWYPHGPDYVKPAPDPGTGYCTMEYDPVCAEKPVVCVRSPCKADRKTFGNSCSARQAEYTILYKGTCQ